MIHTGSVTKSGTDPVWIIRAVELGETGTAMSDVR